MAKKKAKPKTPESPTRPRDILHVELPYLLLAEFKAYIAEKTTNKIREETIACVHHWLNGMDEEDRKRARDAYIYAKKRYTS